MPVAASTVPAESRMATRRVTGTTLKPSRKARDAAEAEAELEEEPEARPLKKTKKQRTTDPNNENHALPLEANKPPEFQFNTLPVNRTSKRASNVIKLTAKTDGIPRADTNRTTTPARVVAGQRQPVATPAPPKCKLSAETAAQLIKMRHPFVSPAQVPQRPREHQHGTPRVQSQGSQRPETPAPARPAQGSSSSARSAFSQPPTTSAPPANARAPSTSRTEVNRSLSSAQSAPPRSVSPVGEPNPRLYDHVTRYAVSSVAYADAVGKMPRIQTGFHVAALDDVDDEWTDPGEPFEDYVQHPRAHATALAYSSRLNAAMPQVDDFDTEEQEEMDQDPDADLESFHDEDDHAEQVHPPFFEYDQEAEADNDHDQDQPLQHGIVAPVNSRAQSGLRTAVEGDDEADDDTDAPCAQHRAVPEGKKIGVRDYEPTAQEILERAITIFKTHVTAENAYPDKLQDKTWAKAAWRRATHELDIKMKPDGRAIELIARNAWGLRGEIKGYARNFVPGAYGFKQVLSTDADGIAQNVSLARQLLGENAFKYKDPSTREGLFEGDIIQTIVNKVWYKSPSDDGVIHDDVYRPFPVRGVALILTAVQCAIQEWSSGLHQNVKFDELIYEPEYKIHHQDLLAFEEDSKELKIVSAICLKLAQYGRDLAKAPLTQQRGSSGGLSSDDLARAVAAYRLKLQNV